MAALSWGIEALMLGSLMILASGVLASSPNSARSSDCLCCAVRCSGKAAIIRPAREISRNATDTPAAFVNDHRDRLPWLEGLQIHHTEPVLLFDPVVVFGIGEGQGQDTLLL